ncbi:DUF6907 domain-containing protein [Streptomyces sp. NPDC007901]|uniref:DUF6907 domain-containing protein n=1 Tax=Streptomyces sp. NPDC007901 TaxID=3364785 RepID=UPI0036E88AA1
MTPEPRTVQVGILTVRTLEIDEPDWCAGHPDLDSDEARAQFKPDVTHYGEEHVLEAPNGDALLKVMLAQSPYAELAPTTVELYVEAGDYAGGCDPEGIEELADSLVDAAAKLRALGRQLARILDGGTA